MYPHTYITLTKGSHTSEFWLDEEATQEAADVLVSLAMQSLERRFKALEEQE